MKNESGVWEESRFLHTFRLFQKIAQEAVCVLWLVLVVVTLRGSSGWWHSAFDACSVALLGLSIFNFVSMISFIVVKQERFYTGRFLILLGLALIAILALAVHSFVMGVGLR
jgi:hypothetical protein